MTTTSTGHLGRRVATSTALAVVGLLLSGCGGGEDQRGRDAAPTASVTPSAPGTTPDAPPGGAPTPRVGEVGFTELATFAETRLRMEEGTATVLSSRAAVTRWLPAGAPRRLVDEVDQVGATVGDGARPYGLVLAVGCDAPEGYTLERVDGDLVVRVEKSLTTTQCLMPTTWLAVVGVGVGQGG